MIANTNELDVAFRHLRAVQDSLDLLRDELAETDPSLFPAVAKPYLRRIRTFESDIFAYLRDRPADAPLKVRMDGPIVPHGKLRVGTVARLLQALQSALIQEAKVVAPGIGSSLNAGREQTEQVGLSSLLAMNLIATQAGSFVLALDLARPQPGLFSEYDVAERALMQLLGHITELSEPAAAFSGGKPVLRSIDKLAALVKPDRLATIEFSDRGERISGEATITSHVRDRIGGLLGQPRAGEETVKGKLYLIDTEKNTCRIRPEGQESVTCNYVEDIEDDLIPAVKKLIEVSGVIEVAHGNPERRTIRLIERFRVVDPDREYEDALSA